MTFFDISGNQMPSPYLGSTSPVYPSHQSAPSSPSETSSRFCFPKSCALNTDLYSLVPFLQIERDGSLGRIHMRILVQINFLNLWDLRTNLVIPLRCSKFKSFHPLWFFSDRELNISGSPITLQLQSFSDSENQATSNTASHRTFSPTPPNLSQPSFSQQESMPPIQSLQPYQFQSSANNFEQSPQVITFNSRSENPKPNVWNRSDLSNQEFVGGEIYPLHISW